MRTKKDLQERLKICYGIIFILILIIGYAFYLHPGSSWRFKDSVCVDWEHGIFDWKDTRHCEMSIENNYDFQNACFWEYDCIEGVPYYCKNSESDRNE